MSVQQGLVFVYPAAKLVEKGGEGCEALRAGCGCDSRSSADQTGTWRLQGIFKGGIVAGWNYAVARRWLASEEEIYAQSAKSTGVPCSSGQKAHSD